MIIIFTTSPIIGEVVNINLETKKKNKFDFETGVLINVTILYSVFRYFPLPPRKLVLEIGK